jgi:hypothetical protein
MLAGDSYLFSDGKVWRTALLFSPIYLNPRKIAVYPGKDSMIYVMDASGWKLNPGDTVMLMNHTRVKGVKLENLKDAIVTTEEKDTPIGGYGAYAFVLNNVSNLTVQNFTVDGKGISNSLFAMSNFKGVTIENFTLRNSSAMGLNIKTDYVPQDAQTKYPAVDKDLTIRYGTIENTGTEGAYIGTSKLVNTDSSISVPIINADVHHLTFINTGWDALQFSNVQGVSLHDISITNYGTKNVVSQRSGLLFGAGVTVKGWAANISITEGTGTALNILCKDSVHLKYVRLIHTAKTSGELGVFADNRSEPFKLKPQQVTLDSITVDGGTKAAIYNYNRDKTSLPMVVHNYRFTNVPSGIVDFTGGKWWNDTVVAPVVKDDTIRIISNYTVNKSGSVIQFSGKAASKLTMPDKPALGFSFVIQNKGSVNVGFNKRVYFTNGQYRLMIKPGETMWLEFKATTKYTRYIITKRVY